MEERFANKYRIESTRLQNWDYSWNGKYFITICTGDRECFFGNIEDRKVKLSEIGILAEKLWLEIPDHFQYIKLDQTIIMPNHIHGILEICNRRDAINRVPTDNGQTDMNRQKGGVTGNNIPMLHDNLSRVIRWYKGRVSYETRKLQKDYYWQSRFYDSIIRDSKSLDNIRKYIKDNPKNWTTDELNPEDGRQII